MFSFKWGGGGGGAGKGDDRNRDGQDEELSIVFEETRLQCSLGDVVMKSNPLNNGSEHDKRRKLSVSEMGLSAWRRGDGAEKKKEKVALEAAAGEKSLSAEMELPSWGGAPKEKVVEAAACQEFVDEATGHRYTWNEATGESTWL